MIHEKLMKVQSELKAPKNLKNTFGGYNYRSAESILESVKPLLLKHGLSQIITDEMVQVGERIYCKATITLFDTENGEEVSASAWAREAEAHKGMSDSQVTGATSSYARKYAMNGMYAIDDTEDADGFNKNESDLQPRAQVDKPKSKSAPPDIDKLLVIAEKKGVDRKELGARWKAKFGDKTDVKDPSQFVIIKAEIIKLPDQVDFSGTPFEEEM